MSALSNIGEAMFDEAIASGELRPPPPGTPLDLESYFKAPEGWRAAFAMLKGNGFVPPEVDLLQRAERLEEELRDCVDAARRVSLRREIDELRTGFRMAIERLRIV